MVTDLWIYGGTFQLGQRFRTLSIRTGVEAYRSAGGPYASLYAGSAGALGGLRWAVEFRLWDTPQDVEAQVNITVAIPLNPAWTLELAGGRSGPDPLLNSPAGLNASVILSRSLLAPPREPAPVYVVEEGDPTVVVFRLEGSAADSLSVVGDFSGWEPIPMRKLDGRWQVRVPIEPGVYHFGFVADGEWYLPEDAPGKVSDDFGRANATLVIPAG